MWRFPKCTSYQWLDIWKIDAISLHARTAICRMHTYPASILHRLWKKYWTMSLGKLNYYNIGGKFTWNELIYSTARTTFIWKAISIQVKDHFIILFYWPGGELWKTYVDDLSDIWMSGLDEVRSVTHVFNQSSRYPLCGRSTELDPQWNSDMGSKRYRQVDGTRRHDATSVEIWRIIVKRERKAQETMTVQCDTWGSCFTIGAAR